VARSSPGAYGLCLDLETVACGRPGSDVHQGSAHPAADVQRPCHQSREARSGGAVPLSVGIERGATPPANARPMTASGRCPRLGREAHHQPVLQGGV
jgi:hypothetical protein